MAFTISWSDYKSEDRRAKFSQWLQLHGFDLSSRVRQVIWSGAKAVVEFYASDADGRLFYDDSIGDIARGERFEISVKQPPPVPDCIRPEADDWPRQSRRRLP